MSTMNRYRPISMGVLVTLAIQSAAVLIWGGAAEARLQVLETSASGTIPIVERMARIEEQMSMARQSLARIETRLDGQTPH